MKTQRIKTKEIITPTSGTISKNAQKKLASGKWKADMLGENRDRDDFASDAFNDLKGYGSINKYPKKPNSNTKAKIVTRRAVKTLKKTDPSTAKYYKAQAKFIRKNKL